MKKDPFFGDFNLNTGTTAKIDMCIEDGWEIGGRPRSSSESSSERDGIEEDEKNR